MSRPSVVSRKSQPVASAAMTCRASCPVIWNDSKALARCSSAEDGARCKAVTVVSSKTSAQRAGSGWQRDSHQLRMEAVARRAGTRIIPVQNAEHITPDRGVEISFIRSANRCGTLQGIDRSPALNSVPPPAPWPRSGYPRFHQQDRLRRESRSAIQPSRTERLPPAITNPLSNQRSYHFGNHFRQLDFFSAMASLSRNINSLSLTLASLALTRSLSSPRRTDSFVNLIISML